MKFYTDGQRVVKADHRSGAFDKLQDLSGHPNIGDIYSAVVINNWDDRLDVKVIIKNGHIYAFDPNEIKWMKEADKW